MDASTSQYSRRRSHEPGALNRRALATGLIASAVPMSTRSADAPTASSRPDGGPARVGQDRGARPYRQRGAGRDEVILEPDLPIVDALHHLFVRPNLRYMIEDYLADATSGHRVVASVYVEANAFYRETGPELMRPLGEVAFAESVGARASRRSSGGALVCAAIVAGGDLRRGAAVGEYLDAALQLSPHRFRGVRQGANHFPGEALKRYMPSQPPAGLLKDPNFRAGLAEVTQRGLTFDTAVFHPRLGEVADLADAFPGLTIILNHCGLAVGVDRSPAERALIFKDWRDGLRRVAQRQNVICKISGLGLPFWGFGFETRRDPVGYLELAAAWRPYVETSIELFGAERCMIGSDYPSDSSSAGFVPLWNAIKHIVASASPSQKAALFHGTAARIYRIELALKQPISSATPPGRSRASAAVVR